MQCVICLAAPPITPVNPCICRVAFCAECYRQYCLYLFLQCPTCRRSLRMAAGYIQMSRIYEAMAAHLSKRMSTTDERAKYNALIELLNQYAAQNPRANIQPHIRTAITHHENCNYRLKLSILTIAWCIVWFLLTAALVIIMPNLHQLAFAPSAVYGFGLLIKMICLDAYAEWINIPRGIVECVLTGLCLFYTAIQWNNEYMTLCIILWCSNSLSVLFMVAA